jgi:hypothetical protein
MIPQTIENYSNNNWDITHISNTIFKHMHAKCVQEMKTEHIFFQVDLMQHCSKEMADIVMTYKSLINDENVLNELIERISDVAYISLGNFNIENPEEFPKILINILTSMVGVLSTYVKTANSGKNWKKLLDRSVNRLHMGIKSDLNKLIDDRDRQIEDIQKRLIISERRGCEVTLVTAKDVEAYDLEQKKNKSQQLQNETLEADKNLAAFLSDLDKEAKPKQKLKTQKKAKQVHAPQNKSKKEEAVPNKKEGTAVRATKSKKKKGPSQKISGQKLRHEFVSTLYKIGTKEDCRVTQRWITQDPEIIRQFWDRNKHGDLVQRYLGMSDEKIEVQRAFHYLPGIEKILVNTDHRRIYTFPSDKGYGIFAELIVNKENYNGTIYFGIGMEDKVVFHKYFEERKPDDTNINAIFLDKEDAPRNNKEGKNWECTTNQSFEMDEKGVLTIKFDGEDHYIRLFPVRKDLIKPELLNN